MPTQKSVRFDLNELQAQINEEQQNVLTNIIERFPGYFEIPERCIPFQFDEKNQKINKGFPQVFKNIFNEENEESCSKLKEKLKKEDSTEKFYKKGQKSLFAKYFENNKKEEEGDINYLFSLNKEEEKKEKIINDTIKNLEIIGLTEKIKKRNLNDSGSGDHLAMNPVQMDLAIKCMQNIVPRKEQQILKIFENFSNKKVFSSDFNENKEQKYIRIAYERLDEIRSLYLEQIQDINTGNKTWIFAKGIIDIFANEAWILIPIRKVLDALNKRNSISATLDDLEIISLCLIWTVALLLEKPTIFKALTAVNAFFCRFSEIFLIGPEVFSNEIINELIEIIINKFIIEAGRKKMIKLRMDDAIAGFDSFMPFFIDLLQRFEEFSNGDFNFASILLLFVYLNNAPHIHILKMAQALWSTQRNVVRQMTLPITNKCVELILNNFINDENNREENEDLNNIYIEEEINKLLTLYLINLNNKVVTSERNPAIYLIATKHLEILKRKLKKKNKFKNKKTFKLFYFR
ncbi:hypothetical protein Mgra_00002145 [Meloidogyne graminicola]|uniref:RPAP1/MINIYO-like TPR repeats domain-containing protein n=1 Tax=Meloidogyne graminicola TaxID=189291 RepID=A0A8S9ZXX6_9BILA|nr:hypothetical protein Mgra_00002145 [Meloidogyne graminicola]